MLAAAAFTMLLAPQDAGLELVVSAAGKPVAGASVEIAALAESGLPLPGRKGRYSVAQRQFAATVRLPRTVTSSDGRCRLLLSPSQQMLDGATTQEFELRVTAPGFTVWRRALGNRLAPDLTQIELVPQRADAGLALECSGDSGALRGFVVIERAFRARSGRSLWLSDVVPIDGHGLALYPEPPRVPGERTSTEASVRIEGYRVTLLAVARPRRTWTLGPGRHRLDPGPDDGSWRRIVAERGQAPPGPITATWLVGAEQVQLPLDDARAPLLGGTVPQCIDTGAGRVVLDTWDPELPLFVERAPAAGAPDPAGDGAKSAAAEAATELRVVDRREQPIVGAVVWVEDAAMRLAEPAAPAFGTTDRDGLVRLPGMPRGVFRVLAIDPANGEREVPVAFGGAPSPPIRLVRRAQGGNDQPALPGTLLLDLTGAPGGAEDPIEVGVVLADRRVVARRFSERPRLVRIEGLVLGPTTFYVRAGKAPATVMAGVLNGTLEDPAVRPFETPLRRFRLLVMEPDGSPAAGVAISLNDGGDAKRPPPSSALFELSAAAEPGFYDFELALHGTLWIRVHGKDEAIADFAIPLPEQDVGLGVRLKR